MGDPLAEALLEGAFDVLAGGARAMGDGPQGLPEGGLVESVGTGGMGGELGHFLEAGLVGLLYDESPVCPAGQAIVGEGLPVVLACGMRSLVGGWFSLPKRYLPRKLRYSICHHSKNDFN